MRTVRIDRALVLDVITLLTLIVDTAEDDHAGPSLVLSMGADAADLRLSLRDALAEDVTKGDTMNSYHIVLANNEERDIKCDEIAIIDGALVCRNTNGIPVVVYAPEAWSLAELERRDDRG